MVALQRGDELGISKFSNALRGSRELERVRGQVPDSLLSWNCRRAATSGYPCVTLGAIAKVMRNEE